jgi:prophage tail gpP-like protein
MPAPYEIGTGPDAVTLRLGDDTISNWTSYTIRIGVLDVPSTFALRLGWGETARELIQKYQKGDPFELYVGGLLQMTGTLDAREVPEQAHTELDLRGRCRTAALKNDYIRSEKSYSEKSYYDLAQKQLEEVLDDFVLVGSNTANRKAITGARRIVERQVVRASEEVEIETTTTTRIIPKTLNAEIGETRLGFLQRQFKRAGLFIWCGAMGEFIVSEPNANQDPLYGLVRERDRRTDATNIIGCRWKDDAAQRHSAARVHGRGSRGRARPTISDVFVDEELRALGYTNEIAIEDRDCKTKAECLFQARRRIAEERRNGWSLVYTVSGHSTLPTDVESERIVWAPDTVVYVDDQELGINGPHYISGVEFSNNNKMTKTRLTLMRPEDLVYAEEMTS